VLHHASIDTLVQRAFPSSIRRAWRAIALVWLAGCAHAIHTYDGGSHIACDVARREDVCSTPAATESERDRLDRHLRAAVAAASLQDVERFLEQGANPNQRDPDREPLLFAAYETGGPLLVQALLDAGGDVDAANADGTTLLMRVSYRDDLELVQLLLAHGAQTGRERPDGGNALLAASWAGNVEIMQALVAAGASPVVGCACGWPPVALAIHSRKYGAGEFMVDQVAATPDAVPQLGAGLVMAARLGDGVISTRILKTAHGAVVAARYGKHALLTAIARAPLGASGVVLDLLEAGVDPNARAENGDTALMLGVAHGEREIVRLLLASGASRTPTNARGQTARDLARTHLNPQIIRMLAPAAED
jgi:ankyrin repeat protein